jgi:16S rRNA (guanine527-N7)-methyltransferase
VKHGAADFRAIGELAEERLVSYERLLVDRAIPLGLIAAGDADVVRRRHIDDCLRAVACLPSRSARIIDVGSGAGLPGIPLAIARPDCAVLLVEAKARRVAFLESVVEVLSLANVRVVLARAESLGEQGDVVVARAVANADRVWDIARAMLLEGGFVVYFAGASWGRATARALDGTGAKWEECRTKSAPGQGPLVIIRPGSAAAASRGGP